MTLDSETPAQRRSDHSAREAALGYLYQAKLALLMLVQGSAVRLDAAISVELFDDVAWDENGSPTELLQLKHHLGETRSLTDMSADVWKTIGVWLDAGSPADPDGPMLTLVTTQTAADGSAMSSLRGDTFDGDAAVRRLESAARDSEAASTHTIRERFLSLRPDVRAQFVARMRLLDGSPMIGDIDEILRTELRFAIPVGRETPFLDRLWGWWFGRILEMLRGSVTSMTALSLRVFLDDLHSEFEHDNLPTFDDLHLSSSSVPEYDDRPFVHQLRWVAAPDAVLRRAVLDYYKAYAHTARWLEEDLIGVDELQRFETRLVEEWDTAFAWLLQELPTGATETQKQRAGQMLLRTTLDQTVVRIRERYTDPFFARGKHHELSDEGQIGWHPEFRSRLDELLLSRPA